MGAQVSTFKARRARGAEKKKAAAKPEKGKIGILSFEVANVMSKIVLLWQSMSDHEILRLRTDVIKSEGVRNLVSDNESVLLSLACMEKLQDLTAVAGAVARLGERCQEPLLQRFKHVYSEVLKQNVDGVPTWEFPLKEMKAKVKKMEQFIASTQNLYQELEILGDLEVAMRRIKDDGSGAITSRDTETLAALDDKANWHRQEIGYLKDLSLWNRTHDKIVNLLARSICTIHGRILNVFGSPMLRLPQLFPVERLRDAHATLKPATSPLIKVVPLSQQQQQQRNGLERPRPSSSVVVGPFSPDFSHDRDRPIFGSPTSNSVSSSYVPRMPSAGPDARLPNNHHQSLSSGPLITPSKVPVSFYHPPPLENRLRSPQPTMRGSPLDSQISLSAEGNALDNSSASISSKADLIIPPLHSFSELRLSSHLRSSQQQQKSHRPSPFRIPSVAPGHDLFSQTGHTRKVYFDPKNRHHNAPSSTLGGAALALHYANVIITIEKMIKLPHLISHDSRDDLYHMLPKSVRTALRSRLKAGMGKLNGFDADIAGDWKEALERILDWLTPLAQNMIRWQSEHNFEQQQVVARSNILLLQTLYFADVAKSEAAITELLVGLNYICGHEKEKVLSSSIMEYDTQKEVDCSEWQF